MGKGKQLFIAIVVVGLLLATALYVRRDPFEKKAKTDFSSLLPQRTEGSIDKLDVKNKEGSITLEKRGNEWWVVAPKELAADQNVVRSVAVFLENVKVRDIASKNKERQVEFGFSKESPDSISVQAFSKGKEVVAFVIGKPAPDYKGSFILLSTDPQTVYTTDLSAPHFISRGIKEWRSKIIVDLPPDTLEWIKLTNSKGTLEIVKDGEGHWCRKDVPDWPLDMDRLNRLLFSFSGLSWADIVDNPTGSSDYGFNAPQARVTLSAKGQEHVLVLGKNLEEPKGNVWLKLEGDKRVYQVRGPQTESFLKEPTFYKSEKAAPKTEQSPDEKNRR
jgi:hypothetical protein